MKQTTISDFFSDFLDHLEELQSQQTEADIDETPTNVDFNDDTPVAATSPIEQLITKRIQHHLDANTFPSLDEVQSIYHLDQIVRYYNA